MRPGFRLVLGVGLLNVLFVSPVRADLSFSFQFDQSNYQVTAGQTVDVSLYLVQSGIAGSGDINVLGPGGVGLDGAGVLITFPTGPNDPQVLLTSDVSGNDGFDNADSGPYVSVGAGSAVLTESVIIGSPVGGTSVPSQPNTYEALIGTFTFTAGSVGNGLVTPITASIPVHMDPSTFDDIAATSPLPTPLTNIAGGGATITTEGVINPPPPPSPQGVVPEPALLPSALATLGVAGLARWLRSRIVARSDRHRPARPGH